MTEAEWLACADPAAMIEFLRDKASDRKLRMFGVAGCYLSRRCTSDPTLPGIECVVQYADGLGTVEEVRRQWVNAYTPRYRPSWPERPYEWASSFILESIHPDQNPGYPPASELVPLLRDIFGNPFRRVKADPAWLTSTVVALARGIYDSRDFSAMPILADALQDAGCDNNDVLNHCRDSNGVHVRGCWVVDLLLEKE